MTNNVSAAALVFRYLELCQQGHPVSAKELCAACPELLPEVERQIRVQLSMERFVGLPGSSADDPAPMSGEDRQRLNNLDTMVPGTVTGGVMVPFASDPRLPVVTGYEVLGELGRGGMGVVYKARHVKLNRTVALKMILVGGHAGEADLNRFRKEAEAIARLQHPNIVQIFEVGDFEGRPFLCLEYLGSGSLEQKLRGTLLPPHEAAGLVATLAGAMQAAHDRGVIHRDLKPANILLSAEGTPKVTDFGLAKKLDEQDMTATGAVVGTVSYMAPEQAQGKNKELGPACDIYALGAILYECLTGRPPFKAATMHETLALVMNDEPVRVCHLNGRVPADLETICHKCLHKSPLRRYGSMMELAEDLNRFVRGEPIAARPVGTGERVLLWGRRRPALAAALLLGGLLLLVGAVALGTTWQWREAEQANQEADYQRRQAEEQRQMAEGLKEEADRQRLMARQYLYYSRVSLASRSWNDAQIYRMGELLEQERTQLPGEDLRGFEWHYLWRIRAAPQHVLRGHTDFIDCVAWSPDGKRLVSGSRDMTVRIWSADPPSPPLQILKGHAGAVHDVAFSPDGQHLATVSSDRTIKVWEADRGQEVRTLRGHTSIVTSLSWSPDGRCLASASWDKTARIWDTRTWQELLVFKGHTGNVEGVAFSPDGKWLASTSTDRTVKVWDARTGAVQFNFTGHTDGVLDVAWSPDGKRIASASFDKTVRVWNVTGESSKEEMTLRGHAGAVFDVRFRPDGRLLASASRDGTVRLWDTVTGFEYRSIRGHTGGVRAVNFRPDGQRLASASFDKTVRVWDVDTDQDSLPLLAHQHWVWGVAFSPNGQHLASTSLDTSAKVWDLATGQKPRTLLGHQGWVMGVAYSPDGKHLATSSSDRTVKIWSASTSREERTLVGHRGAVHCVAFSPNGKSLVSATGTFAYADQATRAVPAEVKVWRVSDWHEESSLKGHMGGVTSLSFSPDGERLATASYDGTVRIWEMATGREVLSLKWPASWPAAVAFRPDGKQLATGSQEGTLQIWDAVTGRELRRFQGHTEDILGIAYSPDGRRLVSASHDCSLKLWDPTLGYEVLTLKAHTKPVIGVAFSPDGHRMATSCQDGTVRIWDATPLPERTVVSEPLLPLQE